MDDRWFLSRPDGRYLSLGCNAVIVTVYVIMSGIRGSAYAAVVKDILILCVVLFLRSN
jgi:SSS family solute:Na+ symporter